MVTGYIYIFLLLLNRKFNTTKNLICEETVMNIIERSELPKMHKTPETANKCTCKKIVTLRY